MKRKTLFAALLVVLAALQVNGQESVSENGPSLNKKNWFFTVGPTVNVLNAEMDNEVSLSDRMGLGGELSIGKWFTPYFGARTQFQFGALRGFNYDQEVTGAKGYYTTTDRLHRPARPSGYDQLEWTTVNGRDGFWQKFNSYSIGFDIMANITNLFYGTSHLRPIEIVPFVGVGFIHANESNTNPGFGSYDLRAGLRVACNLSSTWAIYAEGKAGIMHNEFDGYVGEQPIDTRINAGLGIQYSINRYVSPELAYLSKEEIQILNNKINQLQSKDQRQDENIMNLDSRVNSLENRPPCPEGTKEVTNIETNSLPTYVRFPIASAKIDQYEIQKLNDVIQYLNQKPSAKILLVGYADKNTGNPSFNMQISKNRVQAVAEYLKNKGINPNRLVLNWKGDVEQPYSVNEWNRVVVITER